MSQWHHFQDGNWELLIFCANSHPLALACMRACNSTVKHGEHHVARTKGPNERCSGLNLVWGFGWRCACGVSHLTRQMYEHGSLFPMQCVVCFSDYNWRVVYCGVSLASLVQNQLYIHLHHKEPRGSRATLAHLELKLDRNWTCMQQRTLLLHAASLLAIEFKHLCGIYALQARWVDWTQNVLNRVIVNLGPTKCFPLKRTRVECMQF